MLNYLYNFVSYKKKYALRILHVSFYFFRGKEFLKKGKTRLLFNTSPKYGTVALVGIGKEHLEDKDINDGFDPKKENVRVAAASNTRAQ